MSAAFADTFYWVAFTNIQDTAHERAKAFTRATLPRLIVYHGRSVDMLINIEPRHCSRTFTKMGTCSSLTPMTKIISADFLADHGKGVRCRSHPAVFNQVAQCGFTIENDRPFQRHRIAAGDVYVAFEKFNVTKG